MKVELKASQILILAAAVLTVLLAVVAWRESHHAEQATLERGRALEAEARAHAEQARAELASEAARTARLKAEREHQANEELRRQKDREIAEHRSRYQAAEAKLAALEQKHDEQVAGIAALDDVQLAEFTVRQLRVLYAVQTSFLPSDSGFTVDRAGARTTLQAGLEVEHLRGIRSAHEEQISSLVNQLRTVEEKAATWAADYASEQLARQTAEGEAIQFRNSSESFRAANERWKEAEAHERGSQRWGSVKDLLITGGLAGAGILTGDKYGYAFAGGVVGSYAIRRVF